MGRHIHLILLKRGDGTCSEPKPTTQAYINSKVTFNAKKL